MCPPALNRGVVREPPDANRAVFINITCFTATEEGNYA